MIVIGERERIRIVELLGHDPPDGSHPKGPTAMRMLYLSGFARDVCCVKR